MLISSPFSIEKSLIFYRLLSLKDEFEYISNKITVKINRNIFFFLILNHSRLIILSLLLSFC